jgi:hypothetical protein
MRPFVLLRIAAVVGFLFFVGHTLGAPWTPGSETSSSTVVTFMKAATIPGMTPTRTYWDFYYGFGVSISVYLLALAAVLWQTAALARNAFASARPFMALLFLSYLAVGVVAARYFFAVPAAMAAVICLCIAVAWWLGRRESPASDAPTIRQAGR